MYSNQTLYLHALLRSLEEAPGLQGLPLDALRAIAGPMPDGAEALLDKAGRLAGGAPEQQDRLVSIFSTLHTRNESPGETWYYGRQKLRFDDSFFPGAAPTDDPQLPENFAKAILEISRGEPGSCAENLIYQLQRFGAALPSGRGRDISLYDFARLRAGLAVALQQSPDELLLIGGGISGIQTYLYDIIRRKAANILKGRSFYIQLLNEAVVFYLLRELQLFRGNILYSSGGNFFLLAPATYADDIEHHRQSIALRLFHPFEDGLSLELNQITMPVEALEEGAFPIFWDALDKKLRFQKQQPFRHLIASPEKLKHAGNGFAYFFEPGETGGEQERDALTGEEITKGEIPQPLPGGDGQMISKLTNEQLNLGRQLRDAQWLHFSGSALPEGFEPGGLGVQCAVLSKRPKLVQPGDLVLALNQPDFTFPGDPGGATWGFDNYSGIVEVKEFEDLAAGSAFGKLGVLRMDVDSLGRILKEAFGKGQDSYFGRYGAMSRSLGHFFKGYLNHLWFHNEDYRHHAQIIYAGGDDLFIVGRWDVSLQLAFDIHRDFTRWACRHPALSISGGLVFVNPKFPISKAAELAGKAEDAAKAYRATASGRLHRKNAISLLGVPLNWQLDYPVVVDMKKKLAEYVQKGVPKGLLMRIQAFYEQRKLQLREDLPESWRWRIAYILERSAGQIRKKSPEGAAFIQGLGAQLFSNSYSGEGALESQHQLFGLLNVAARWAELELREKESIAEEKNQNS